MLTRKKESLYMKITDFSLHFTIVLGFIKMSRGATAAPPRGLPKARHGFFGYGHVRSPYFSRVLFGSP